jgi:hypothetical protein
MRIRVPDSTNFSSMLTLPIYLAQAVEVAEYEFDFADVKFVTPAWLILVGTALREFRAHHPQARRRAVNYHHMGYAAHMGFFRYFGVKFGLKPAEATGSDSYIPITEVLVCELKSKATKKFISTGDIIEEESRKLSLILTLRDDGDLADTLTYSIREIIRNVVEHSRAESYTFAAQYWPSMQMAEIVVSDSGCGILRSLRENPKLTVATEAGAIKLATLPGISSKSWRPRSRSDAWANSGYGLFMTQRLCGLGGEFRLMSGKAALRVNRTGFEISETRSPGTTVVMRLDSSRLGNLTKRLREFRDEGRIIARQVGGADDYGPSAASVALRPNGTNR